MSHSLELFAVLVAGIMMFYIAGIFVRESDKHDGDAISAAFDGLIVVSIAAGITALVVSIALTLSIFKEVLS